ncbi:uncharacterized protein DUF5017 [Mucilaginibacter yixingensis]|uniref:Uncharacterized protein DUF5017 n=1 Tax=Mucilaginibacter yixingensis TaxID=1295612 RepID=A0A2T5J5X9_9SPHI|nr:DUF5017 domain-containing protein [Mucilaginibacter yixingensis]PTQ93965.1 uncharacterized protein DUF5017 [Mucilaginibacter yixingensis]
MKLSYIIAITALALAACNKKQDVPSPSFGVTAVKNNGSAPASFAPGDTVNFKFSGNPNVITFYSGEVGKRYQYINRTQAAGTAQLQFTSQLANGTQAGSLSLLVSTDFKGVALKTLAGVLVRDTATTNANIASATWTDITSRATIPTNTTATSSGLIDLSDLAKQGKPVYFAFKYNGASGTIQNKWTITNFAINNVLSDATTYTIANLNSPAKPLSNYGVASYSPGWAVSYDPAKNANNYAWVYTDGTSLVITGATTAATASAEAWAISGPVDLTKVTPDAGVAIKSEIATLGSYTYSYTQAGSYNAVFVATNATADDSKTTVQQVAVTVK